MTLSKHKGDNMYKSIKVSKELWRKLKELALKEETTIGNIIAIAVKKVWK